MSSTYVDWLPITYEQWLLVRPLFQRREVDPADADRAPLCGGLDRDGEERTDDSTALDHGGDAPVGRKAG